MSKKLILLVIIILAILSISAMIFFLPYLQSTPDAVLEIEKGTVEINTGTGWSKVSSGTELKQSYQIRTGSDGEATIIFSGKSVARLSNDSEVNISELKRVEKQLEVRIVQVNGDVWHSISPVGGISSYVIETPMGNFTEAGTSFGISIGKKKVAVLDGLVFHMGQEQVVLPMRTQAQILTGRPIRIVTLEEDTWVQQNKKADENWLIKSREGLKKKYSIQIRLAKPFGPMVLNTELTDDKINDGIDRYLHGEIDVPKLIEEGKVPEQVVPLIPDEFIKQKNPWFLAHIAITKYGGTPPKDYKKKTWADWFRDQAEKLARDFIAKTGGKGNAIITAAENIGSTSKTVDVYLIYACIDPKGNMNTRVVPLQDIDSMDWWVDGSSPDSITAKHNRDASIEHNKPKVDCVPLKA